MEFGEASQPTVPSRPAGRCLLGPLLVTSGPWLQLCCISQFEWEVAGEPEEDEQGGTGGHRGEQGGIPAIARHMCASQRH